MVRADAGLESGSGHFMRGLALAQAWKGLGGTAALAGSCSPALAARAAAAGVPLRAAAEHAPAPGGWLAVDGYAFGPEELDGFKAAGRTLVVDDYGHRPRLSADVVLNPGSEDHPYPPSDALVLAGPRWAPLRPEFAAEPPRRERKGGRPRLLVCLGGSDPANATQSVLKALAPYEQVDVTAVIGADNPHAASLDSLARDLRRGVPDLRSLMLECDAAIVAGGVTALECAAAGLPMAVLTLAENQRRQAAALCAAGAAVGLDEDLSPARIAEAALAALSTPELGEAGRRLVDGRGAERVARALMSASPAVLAASDVVIRPILPGDAMEIWRLANAVRSFAILKDEIPLSRHLEWFKSQLSDKDVRYWVVEVGGIIAGQIRYSRSSPDTAEVHLSFHKLFRGKGLGTAALRQTSPAVCRELGVRRVRAKVLENNSPSERAFLKAGYRRAGDAKDRGARCEAFEFTC